MCNTALIFSNKNHVPYKKLMEKLFFSVDYVKIIELHVAYT